MQQENQIGCVIAKPDRLGWQFNDVTGKVTAWVDIEQSWTVSKKRSDVISGVSTAPTMHSFLQRTIDHVQHILFATSSPPNVYQLPFLASLRQQYPIEDVKGLPVLTQYLVWHDDVPMFVTGALAGLRFGPGAGNLSGSRLGAERIAWKLEEILDALRSADNRLHERGKDNGHQPEADQNLCRGSSVRNTEFNHRVRSVSPYGSRSSTSKVKDDTNPSIACDTDLSTTRIADDLRRRTVSKCDLLDEYLRGSGNQISGLTLSEV